MCIRSIDPDSVSTILQENIYLKDTTRETYLFTGYNSRVVFIYNVQCKNRIYLQVPKWVSYSFTSYNDRVVLYLRCTMRESGLFKWESQIYSQVTMRVLFIYNVHWESRIYFEVTMKESNLFTSYNVRVVYIYNVQCEGRIHLLDTRCNRNSFLFLISLHVNQFDANCQIFTITYGKTFAIINFHTNI